MCAETLWIILPLEWKIHAIYRFWIEHDIIFIELHHLHTCDWKYLLFGTNNAMLLWKNRKTFGMLSFSKI